VLAWFSAALRQLLAAREDLAARAVLRERLRIDAELAGTVGAALGSIAGRGTAISRLAASESQLAAEQLGTLVDGSRQTLAETRRMIRTYQRRSLGAELDTAVALLGAAGIQARLVLPGGDLIADEPFAASLRAVVDRLLHDGSVCACRLTVVRSAGGLRLLLDADGSDEVMQA
jgi:two-component system sensor histidine kinase DesK